MKTDDTTVNGILNTYVLLLTIMKNLLLYEWSIITNSKVPAEISHADFWKRYFYKVHQLQQDEARKSALMKRAEQAQKKEDSISWEGEDDLGYLCKSWGEDDVGYLRNHKIKMMYSTM